MSEAAEDVPTIGEVGRGVDRIERQLGEFRAEVRTLIDAKVSKEAHSAEMATVHARSEATDARVTKLEIALKAVEDERDRTRLAITVALLTALAAPIVVALLLKGV